MTILADEAGGCESTTMGEGIPSMMPVAKMLDPLLGIDFHLVVPSPGVPPVLMVQTTHDPATPYEGAVRAHAAFAGSLAYAWLFAGA